MPVSDAETARVDDMSGFACHILDALDEGIYTIDPDGACQFVNGAALRMLGYERAGDLLGRNMHDLIHHTRPDGGAYPRAECPLVQTARGGHPVRLANETLWRRDRTPFLAEYSAYPIIENGRAAGSIITFREELVREDARARLAVQYAVGQALTGSAGVRAMIDRVLETVGTGFGWEAGRYWQNGPDGLALFSEWRQAGLAARANALPNARPGPAARAWADKRAFQETSLGRPLGPDDFGARSGLAFPVGAGEAAFGVMEFFSRRIVPADPSLLGAVEGLGQMVGQALERFRAATALRESETRFRVFADAIPQLSWMTDPDGTVNWYNQRWYDYTGRTFDQMSGWGWRTVQHPDHVERVIGGFRASIQSGEPWEDSFPLRAADGSYRWFLSRALPIRDDRESDTPGRIVGWFGSNTDITAMREAERGQMAALDAAEAANRAKSLFLANMSHELRTPLSAIIGYTEILMEEVQDGDAPGQMLSDIGKIETNARHLLGLISSVLDLSKIESGKMEVSAERFDVAAIVTEAAAAAATLAAKNGNSLAVELGDGLGSMYSDAMRIGQMLLNLLSNAAKFTSFGRITLSAAREGEQVRFTVTDTGLGMTAEQIGDLFQRFQQADASTTRRFGGTGLGLSLTRVFSRLLGGDVMVSSVPGQGSTFTILLPDTLPEAAQPSGRMAMDGPNRP